MKRNVTAAFALAFGLVWTGAAQENLLENSSFEETIDPWSAYNAELSHDNDNAYEGSSSLRAAVAEAGANFWDSGVQYKPEGLSFAGSTLHTWAFFAKSDPPVEINIKPELAANPWTAYAQQRANLTADWTEYYVEFMPDAEVSPASLTLHVGFAPASIWLDHVRYYHGEYTPGDIQTSVEPTGKAAAVWGSLKTR